MFDNRLKQLREARGLTMRQAAAEAEAAPTTVTQCDQEKQTKPVIAAAAKQTITAAVRHTIARISRCYRHGKAHAILVCKSHKALLSPLIC